MQGKVKGVGICVFLIHLISEQLMGTKRLIQIAMVSM